MINKTRRARFPKLSFSNVVAIPALSLSVASIAITVWNSREQKRQWKATALGRVEITSVSFIYWRTYSEEELQNPKWGYKVDLMPLLENNKVSKLYGLPSRLIAYDPISKRSYPEITALTLDEITNKLRNGEGLPASIIPAKQFQFQWDFLNVSATAVTDLRIAVDSRMPDTGSWEEGPWGQPAELGPGRTALKISELTAPVEASIPTKLSFRVRLEYLNIENEKVTRAIPVYFNSPTGAFNFGE